MVHASVLTVMMPHGRSMETGCSLSSLEHQEMAAMVAFLVLGHLLLHGTPSGHSADSAVPVEMLISVSVARAERFCRCRVRTT